MAVETDSYIQSLIAERIGGVRFGREDVIYKFEKIKRAKARARREFPGVEIIDMGVGEPDEMAFPEVVEVLRAEAANPRTADTRTTASRRSRTPSRRTWSGSTASPGSTRTARSSIPSAPSRRSPCWRQPSSTPATRS